MTTTETRQPEPDSLGTFGEMGEEEQATLDQPPIPFTILGYPRSRDAKGERAPVEFTFHVRPAVSFGPVFNVLMETQPSGGISMAAAVQFIGDTLVAEERDQFHATLRRPDLEFSASALGQMAEALAERYGLRPKASRSARRATQRQRGRTSTAGRSAKA